MAEMISGSEVFTALMGTPPKSVDEVRAAVDKAVENAGSMRDLIASQKYGVDHPGANKTLESSVAYAEPAAEQAVRTPAPEAPVYEQEAEAQAAAGYEGPDMDL